MKFNYQARNKKGEIRIGQIQASSKEAAIIFLQKRELYVVFLEEEEMTKRMHFFNNKIKVFKKISKKDLIIFSQQLSIMFRTKVPLVEALRVFSTQTPNHNFKEKILKISQEVEGGNSLSAAFALYPKVFSSFYVAMIKAGETSGELSKSLEYLAKHLEREHHLISKARWALVYPALIILTIIGVLVTIAIFVVPQLSGTLIETGRELPLMTKIVISIAEGIKNWGFLIFIIIVIIIIFSIKYSQTKKGKYFFDNLLLRIPIINKVLKMIYTARFAENISTLISSGLPIAKALAVTRDIIDNAVYKEAIFKVQKAVKKGETISSVLFGYSKLFPPIFIQMVLVGEKTGTLNTTLMSIVSFYQKEVDRAVDATLTLLEPILIIFLGIVVGIIVVAILMPLYKGISVMGI